jgi:hypothetical protein
MIFAHILVEGQTEETFVTEVLGRHLHSHNIQLTPSIAKTSRRGSGPSKKGGVSNFAKIEFELGLLLRNAGISYVTTMFDYHKWAGDDFPGWGTMPASLDCWRRVKHLEDHFAQRIDDPKFVPYLSLHEFESLLFASPDDIVRNLPGLSKEGERAIKNPGRFDSPEEINDNEPPSKRIEKYYRSYDKINFGSIIALDIGLEKIRAACTHFNQWVTKLESWSHPT